MSEGWASLQSESFIDLLLTLHNWFLATYDEVYEAVCGQPYQARAWFRPTLLRGAKLSERTSRIDWIEQDTARQLFEFASSLRDLDQRTLQGFQRHRRAALTNMIMGSPMYALTLLERDPVDGLSQRDLPVELILNAKLFSAIGGAGLFGMEGASAVRISRGTGVLSSSEIARRDSFQHDFARYASMQTALQLAS